jgi:hypothetical protein
LSFLRPDGYIFWDAPLCAVVFFSSWRVERKGFGIWDAPFFTAAFFFSSWCVERKDWMFGWAWESFSDIQSSLLLDCQLLCRTIYNMCTQKPPQDYSQQLYDRYRESFEEYINSMVCTEHAWFCFIFLLPLWLCYHAFGDPRWWWSVVSPRSFSLESCVNKFEPIWFLLRKSWTSVDFLRNPNLEDA